VSNDDQLSAFLFDLSGDTVYTDRQEVWLGVWGISGTVGLGFRSGQKSSLLSGTSFWSVFFSQLEETGSGLLVQSL